MEAELIAEEAIRRHLRELVTNHINLDSNDYIQAAIKLVYQIYSHDYHVWKIFYIALEKSKPEQ